MPDAGMKISRYRLDWITETKLLESLMKLLEVEVLKLAGKKFEEQQYVRLRYVIPCVD